MTEALTLLERAAGMARDFSPLPPHADAVLSMLALSIMGIIQTSPDAEAERLAAIAKVARRT